MQIADLSVLISIIGLLTLCTNVITEVLKKSFREFPAEITALIVAMLLTVGTATAYIQIKGLPFEWYYVGGMVVLGFFVSYAAQFGFDKLKELINKYKE